MPFTLADPKLDDPLPPGASCLERHWLLLWLALSAVWSMPAQGDAVVTPEIQPSDTIEVVYDGKRTEMPKPRTWVFQDACADGGWHRIDVIQAPPVCGQCHAVAEEDPSVLARVDQHGRLVVTHTTSTRPTFTIANRGPGG